VPPSNQNNQDIWSKIYVIERELLEKEKSLDRLDDSLLELNKKIEQLKDDLRNLRVIPDLEERIKYLEDQVDAIRLELPEIRLIKKLFMGMVAFVLTAFLGLIWNTVVIKSSQETSMKLINSSEEQIGDIAKKVIDEYQKGKK
jgi:DNA repair exonuclease SbcCD ATPase subunit